MYDQIIDDHIIFTNVVSNKNTDFQLYIFRGLNLIIILCFKEMRNILGYEKKNILLVNYLVRTKKRERKKQER